MVKDKIIPHIYMSRPYNGVTVTHGMMYEPAFGWINLNRERFEGELIEYRFRNLVPHSFSGHFNTLTYDKQMKVLAKYKSFN